MKTEKSVQVSVTCCYSLNTVPVILRKGKPIKGFSSMSNMDGRKSGSLLPIRKSSLSSLFSAESSGQKSLMSPVTELSISMEQR